MWWVARVAIVPRLLLHPQPTSNPHQNHPRRQSQPPALPSPARDWATSKPRLLICRSINRSIHRGKAVGREPSSVAAASTVPGGCMYAGGESRPNGGGGGGDALRWRRQPGAAAASSSSSSGRGAEEEREGHGRGQKQSRRKTQQGRREAVARAIRGGLPSCWGGVSVVQEAASGGRRWSRPERAAAAAADRDVAAGGDGAGPGAGAGTATAAPPAAWCCVCPGGDCSLEPNPSANGKEDLGVRSLLERNEFFSADCNPHVDILPAAAYESS